MHSLGSRGPSAQPQEAQDLRSKRAAALLAPELPTPTFLVCLGDMLAVPLQQWLHKTSQLPETQSRPQS